MLRPASLLAFLLVANGCAHNPYAPAYKVAARHDAYQRYRPTPIEIAQLRASYEVQKADWEAKHKGRTFQPHSTVRNPYAEVKVTDLDVLLYADHVRNILATRYTNARWGTYTSATVQVLLAGAAGAAAAFSAGTSVIAGLAFGSAVTPEVTRIFTPRQRAELYQQQAMRIDIALKEFAETDTEAGGITKQASDTHLTQRGRDLYVQVVTATNAVDTGLVTTLPETMSREQAEKLAKEVNTSMRELLVTTLETRQDVRDFGDKMEDLGASLKRQEARADLEVAKAKPAKKAAESNLKKAQAAAAAAGKKTEAAKASSETAEAAAAKAEEDARKSPTTDTQATAKTAREAATKAKAAWDEAAAEEAAAKQGVADATEQLDLASDALTKAEKELRYIQVKREERD